MGMWPVASASDPLRRRELILLVLCCFLLLSAALPNPADAIRDGNAALERFDYDSALRAYHQAEERGNDPGLIAFNKGIAYYHRNDFRDAAQHFRMALDDTLIPPERRWKAFFNLANCLVRETDGKHIPSLRDAIRCYESCLEFDPPADFRKKVEHNLQVAKLMWIAAHAEKPNSRDPNSGDQAETPRPQEPKKKKDASSKQEEPEKKQGGTDAGKDPSPKARVESAGNANPMEDAKKLDVPPPRSGLASVIPDTDQVMRRSVEETQASLREVEHRLQKIRERLRAGATTLKKPSGRDW